MSTRDPDRKQSLTDAAFGIVGEKGLRALTHRAADEAAGLPAGTCSYHYPTRQALLAAVLHRIADLDRADLDAALAGRTVTDFDAAALVEDGTQMLAHWLGPARARSRARMLLMLDPQTRALTTATTAAIAADLETLATAVFGDPEHGSMLMALVDGILVDELTHGREPVDTERLRARFSAIVGLALRPAP
ncbi:TetR/AcrR family transcriptional regulator [Actinoplanes aureus]|uniref:TetR family transcriptional regulator n=1 Tax=Actinoplanes aureus TaxID=2792083 RepID=A0A931CAN5_9ACTN|nr:TetR family transcriptional regulator [Actinoplanes aureus]MBG0566480.1 TetR family transcriptional regulator [Actinoplanes aureus]